MFDLSNANLPPQSAAIASTSQQQAGSVLRTNAVPRIDSRGLMQGSRELVIEHVGLEYRLQVTRNGKLILTK